MFYTYKDSSLILIEAIPFIMKKIKEESHTFVFRGNSSNNYKTFIDDAPTALFEMEQNLMNTIKNSYEHPVFFYIKKRDGKLKKDINDISYTTLFEFDVYAYKRNDFVEEMKNKRIIIEEQENIFKAFENISFFNIRGKKKKRDLLDYYKELEREEEEFFNNLLNEYFSWFDEKFIILQLPSSLLEELKQITLISLKKDLLYPFTILDKLVEKITTFFLKGDKLKERHILNYLIEESVEEFILYVQNLVSLLRKIDERNIKSKSILQVSTVLNEETKNEIKYLKSEIFNN